MGDFRQFLEDSFDWGSVAPVPKMTRKRPEVTFTQMTGKIAELQADREVLAGQGISDMIHVAGKPEQEVYAQYGVTADQAQRLMDKAAHLFALQSKLKRLDPNYDMEAELAQH